MELSTGLIIKRARQKKGLTQEDLAALLCVSKSTVQKYENGYVQNLKLDTIRNLCIHLEIMAVMLIFPEDLSNKTRFDCARQKDAVAAFYRLNDTGKQKACEYMLDLLGNEEYQ